MSDKELEALAEELSQIFHNGDRFDEHANWLRVAEFIANRDMNTEHRALYGYDLPSRVADELLNDTKWP